MEQSGVDSLTGEGVPEHSRRTTHAVDIRYAAQEYTLTVPVLDADEPLREDFLEVISKRFAEQHESRYGHANLGAPVEFVTLRTTAFGDLGRADTERIEAKATEDFPREVRSVVFDRAERDTLLVRRDDLVPGHTFDGPAIVLEGTATTVVPPGHQVTADEIGSLVVRSKEQ
jgi:N-methylhydantoinase A